MRRQGLIIFTVGMFVVVTARAVTNDDPNYTEVRGLLRTNLPGMTDGQLDAAAVKGLLEGFSGRVVLATGLERIGPATNVPAIGKSAVLDDGVVYLRVSRVGDGLAKELSAAWEQSVASNQIKGLVLDLRFTSGGDYAAATAAAEVFARSNKNATRLPLAVLVNGETSGAAEALAAAVRQSGAGLILGGKTAGRAAVMQEFTLKTGQRLLVASAPVKLADGYMLTAEDVRPDIVVSVKAEDERVYYADAYANITKTNLSANAGLSLTNQPGGTNRPARKRVSEADLVRKHREGSDGDEDELPAGRPVEPERPVLRDPALARAVDLVKGLALVRQAQGGSK